MMCPFKPAYDANGCWGECIRCGKRVGFVTHEDLWRRFSDSEFGQPRAGSNPAPSTNEKE